MSGVGRASVLIGAGTVVSRLTGFVRSAVLVAAIGSIGRASDAFGVANQLPNNIYAIVATGLVAAVIVPQIVRASRDPDGGQSFISKLMTLGTVALLAVTVLATACAPLLVQLYAPSFGPDQFALATAFAYWCLPQILFYGMYALLGETLNARRVFGPYTWAPIINNVVSIVGFVAFIVLFGGGQSSAIGWTPQMVALLAGTATLGIVAQTLVLLLFWRRAGLRLRPDFRWRGIGLRHIGRLAGWTFLMVIVGQLAGIVQSRVLSLATDLGPANFASGNAWLLFMLPYSIIVLSIGTPYFTQLSEHAKAGRHDEVRRDIPQSIRTLGLFVVVATAGVAAAAVPASRILTTSADEAVSSAWLLGAYLISLIPLAVLFVIQRTFYAYDDTRTPFFFTIVQASLVVITALVAEALAVGDVIDITMLASAVALGQSCATLVQVIVATWLLRRRLGNIGVSRWMLALGRFTLAAIPAGIAGWLVFVWSGGVEGWMVSSQLLGAVGTGVICAVALVVYVPMLMLLRAPELAPAVAMLRRVIPGGMSRD
ncbi:murein biosynthesis integral membrane protein MurJ [Microbacterium sp. C7(2022)]|uniref:murein biosynthesis integral membrane protein MurJ n=1 Tax=Microbacterium sp. C7(2022) TaxID=2992759 RepID=UPI00237C197C|nr:murein biosynthesis integral membrane protein MurJ [Microbacterium sp. C7(2022)]MDE0546305.1 murein biosynthesis integral membrane protein MurJ [Microbacterium sp. C7(2022)]